MLPTSSAPPPPNSDKAAAASVAGQSSRRRLWPLLSLLVLMLAVALWVNTDALRRWQYHHATTGDLLLQARRRPGDLLLARMSGQRLLQDNRAVEAREVLVPLAEAHPEDAELNVLAGRAEWQVGSSQKAGVLFKTALQADPASAEAHYWTGELLYRRGRKDLAEKLMLDATRLAPNRGDVWTRLAEIALQALDYQTALERLEQAEKVTPTGQVAWLRASALQSLGRLAEAEVAARQGLARDPKPEAYVLLAEIVQSSPEAARQREAQRYLKIVLQQAPTATNALKLLAINHRSLGEHRQAIKVLRRLLQLVPSQTEAYLMLSQSYQALGRRDLAARTMRLFRRLEPLQTKADFAEHRLSIEHGSLSAQLQYIRALLALGRHDLAARVIARARDKNPDNAELQALSHRVEEPPSIQIEPLPADSSRDAP